MESVLTFAPEGPRMAGARIRDVDFGYDQARHLLLRAGFGGTPDQIRTLADWGAQKAVDYLLGYEEVPDADPPLPDRFDRDIIRPPTEDERRMYANARSRRDEDSLAQLRLRQQQAERNDRRQMREIQKWWLARMISTPRPLQEKMTLFWHGHFATSFRTIENSYHMYMQNQLFRSHAAGNFGELLFAIIRDPAMLAYLDNNDSRKDQPNENLARELMELFSLGLGNYSERDIKEGARALTGYSFRDDSFEFNANNHDTGRKSILGVTGTLDGDGFVKAILSQRAASLYICRKFYRFFATEIDVTARERDLPKEAAAMISDMDRAMRRANFEVKPALRALLFRRGRTRTDQESRRPDRGHGAFDEHTGQGSVGAARCAGPHGSEHFLPAERQGLGRRAFVDQHLNALCQAEHPGVSADGQDAQGL